MKRSVFASRVLLITVLVLLNSCGAGSRPEPNLETQFKELTAILDSTIREFQIEVARTEDRRSAECTTNVGWTNTGKYKQARSIEGTLPSQPDLRALVQRIGDRWRAEKFAVRFWEAPDGVIISIYGRDEQRGDLFFDVNTKTNQAHLSVETICLKP